MSPPAPKKLKFSTEALTTADTESMEEHSPTAGEEETGMSVDFF